MSRVNEVTNLYDVTIEMMDACNGRALIRSLANDILPAIEAEPEQNGTDYINRHPALTLWLEKLCSLNGYPSGYSNGDPDSTKFSEAYAICRERSLRNK
jgi:hypothetical protein